MRRLRPGAAERRLEERRATLRSEIARAEGKLANEGFVAKAPAGRRRRRAREARAPAGGARGAVTRAGLDVGAAPDAGAGGGGRALAAVARAVRDALRPGPHAAADDRARRAAGALRVDPRRRHERQVVDGADDRRAAARATACARAPTCRRTSSPSPSASASTAPTSPTPQFAAAVGARRAARRSSSTARWTPTTA